MDVRVACRYGTLGRAQAQVRQGARLVRDRRQDAADGPDGGGRWVAARTRVLRGRMHSVLHVGFGQLAGPHSAAVDADAARA